MVKVAVYSLVEKKDLLDSIFPPPSTEGSVETSHPITVFNDNCMLPDIINTARSKQIENATYDLKDLRSIDKLTTAANHHTHGIAYIFDIDNKIFDQIMMEERKNPQGLAKWAKGSFTLVGAFNATPNLPVENYNPDKHGNNKKIFINIENEKQSDFFAVKCQLYMNSIQKYKKTTFEIVPCHDNGKLATPTSAPGFFTRAKRNGHEATVRSTEREPIYSFSVDAGQVSNFIKTFAQPADHDISYLANSLAATLNSHTIQPIREPRDSEVKTEPCKSHNVPGAKR